MAALQTTELWLVCYTALAFSVIILTFDLLWSIIMHVVEDLYGGIKTTAPTRLQ